MITPFKKCFLFLTLAAAVFAGAAEADFSDVEVEEPFYPYLTAKKRFMELPGVKEFTSPDGKSRIIVCVTSTASKGNGARALADMIKVCRIKAQVELCKADGYELSAFERAEDHIVSIGDGKHEKIQSVSSYLNVAEERVNSVVRTWPVIGTWYSKDGSEFYLAIGTIISNR
jgi:hypothetical protein